MIDKADMLTKVKEMILSEGYTMPLYIGHLLQTLPWYGLSAEMEKTTHLVLTKIKSETEDGRKIIEEIYRSVQERKYGEY